MSATLRFSTARVRRQRIASALIWLMGSPSLVAYSTPSSALAAAAIEVDVSALAHVQPTGSHDWRSCGLLRARCQRMCSAAEDVCVREGEKEPRERALITTV